MAKQVVVYQNFTRLKQADVPPFAVNTVQKMTNNPYFTDPRIDLGTMQKGCDQYNVTMGNRLNGKNARDLFTAAKKDLLRMLREQAKYVSQIADGNPEVITSGGWEASKASPSKKTVPAQPKAPAVSFKNGEVVVSTSAVKGATSYLWFIFLGTVFPITITNNQLDVNQSAKFSIVPAGTTRECVRNIPVGTDITVQVLAQNAAGKSSFSVPVSFHTGG